MRKRNRTVEILQVRSRGSEHPSAIAWAIKRLCVEWKGNSSGIDAKSDYYIVKAVTLLEVFTKRWVKALVDHSNIHAERATALLADYKPDFVTLLGIHGRVITFGEVASHTIPVNSFRQIIDCFSTILEKPIPQLLKACVDPWDEKLYKEKPQAVGPPVAIISDYAEMARQVTRLFDVRHIVCHEIPEKPAYQSSEVQNLLEGASSLAEALNNLLSAEVYGPPLLTTVEMRDDALTRLKLAESEMNDLISRLSAFEANEPGIVDVLNESQNRWTQFRNANCDLITHNMMGSIRAVIWSSEACDMTKRRIEELQAALKSREKLRT